MMMTVRAGSVPCLRDGKMTDTDTQYLGCPVCGYVLLFRYDEKLGKYIALCPYCEDYYEIETERYFEFE